MHRKDDISTLLLFLVLSGITDVRREDELLMMLLFIFLAGSFVRK